MRQCGGGTERERAREKEREREGGGENLDPSPPQIVSPGAKLKQAEQFGCHTNLRLLAVVTIVVDEGSRHGTTLTHVSAKVKSGLVSYATEFQLFPSWSFEVGEGQASKIPLVKSDSQLAFGHCFSFCLTVHLHGRSNH